MAIIRTWLLRDHRHPLNSSVVVSREIHLEGDFSDEEWFRLQTMLATMRRAGSGRAALPEGCLEAEVIPPQNHLP